MANESDWFTCTKEEESLTWQLRGHKEVPPAQQDPYDPSCLAAFLQDPSPDGCTAAVDADGQACEFCSFQDSIDVCLTAEQAEMAEQFGIACDAVNAAEETDATDVLSDPYDPSCALAYLQDQSEESCRNAVDADGNACEYCTLQGSMNFCLNDEQAAMAEQFGMECDGENEETRVQDPYDPSCALAYLQDQSEEACKSAVDSDGIPCEYCTLQGSVNLCLNEEQAQMGEALGIECDSTQVANAAPAPTSTLGFPSDLWGCLQNYDESGCASSSCTWCNTEVGIGFCMADAAADAMRECNFFDCNYKTDNKEENAGTKTDAKDIHPFDPACLGGMESEEVCSATQDSAGGACVWCDAAGVFGLCLSADGAEAASDYLTCDTLANAGVTTKVW
jgi:hypothetical protein